MSGGNQTPPNASPAASPAKLLQAAPKRGPGVRRLNQVPLAIAGVAGVIVAGAIGYTYHVRAEQNAAAVAADAKPNPKPASDKSVLADAPADGHIEAEGREQQTRHSGEAKPAPAGAAVDRQAIEARKQAWQTYYTALAERRQHAMQTEQQALSADPGVGGGITSSGQPKAALVTSQGAAGGAGLMGATAKAPGDRSAVPGGAMGEGYGGLGYPALGMEAPPVPGIDVAGQREKQDFLAKPGSIGQSDYLQATLKPPISRFEVQAGSVIPAVMVGGVNSDLPGQLIAQVSQTVYDSVTGRIPLIPQGSKLIGTYDNQVAAGQSRVLVAWNRVIFPNGWSMDLGQMPGADQGGYAGFHDQVNDHFWMMFKNAMLLSLFGAGAQLSQPQASGLQNVGAGQTAASAVGIQMAELGQMYASRGLSIPPTLQVRPGYRFVVMVTKDMVFPGPWHG